MKYSEKASKYLELCGIEHPTSYQQEKISNLRRELAALGLDPQHPKGLTYRALVYDNRRVIEAFLDLIESKKDTNGLGRQLRGFGIDISKPQELRRLLASFKTNAKAIDKKKTTKGVNLARQACDADLKETQDEIRAMDLEAAIEEEAKQQEARAERERICSESFQAWVSETVTTAAAAATT